MLNIAARVACVDAPCPLEGEGKMVAQHVKAGEGLRAQRARTKLPLTLSLPLHDRTALSRKGRGRNNVRPLLRMKKGGA